MNIIKRYEIFISRARTLCSWFHNKTIKRIVSHSVHTSAFQAFSNTTTIIENAAIGLLQNAANKTQYAHFVLMQVGQNCLNPCDHWRLSRGIWWTNMHKSEVGPDPANWSRLRQDSAFFLWTQIGTPSQKFVKNRTRSHFSSSAVAGVCAVIS